MNRKPLPVASLIRLLAVVGGLAILAACGGGSSSSNTATPAVSLSTSTLTFSGQFVGSTSAAQMVTVSNTGTADLNFSSISISGDFANTNTCGTRISAGGDCSVSVTFSPTQAGTRTGTLTITDNASGSPQTVSLTGTGASVSLTPTSLTFSGTAVGSTSAPQAVTLTNTANVALAISSVAITTGSSYFSQTNNCGTGVGASGGCKINVTFTPPSTGTLNGTLTVTDNTGGVAGSTQTVALTGSSSGSNTVSVTVGFGPNGFSTTGDSYYNGIYTSVTICNPGTTTCATVPNVLVDSGSYGLRVLSSALTSVTLPQVNDPSTGDPIYECVQYGDLSYTWGPIQSATVQIGGETASQIPTASGGTANSGIPIQVISAGVTPPAAVGLVGSNQGYDNPCLFNPVTGNPSDGLNDDTVANLGANGILGIGVYPQDCGTNCTTIANTTGQYLICDGVGSQTCDIQAVALQQQAWNPVAAFSSGDSNGELIQLPSIGAGGEATVPGTLTFGIGTQSDNALNGATVYELDTSGNFQSSTLYGVTYTSSNTGKAKDELIHVLNSFLLQRHQEGLTTILVVDEAHLLSAELLEEIRLLTNLETSQQKLLQIVLAGQPELDQKLDSHELRQLKQRIAMRCHLEPLSANETREYMSRRLRIAGAPVAGETFSGPAIEAVFLHSRGIPRLINTICENALLAGYAKHAATITSEIIDGVARDLRLGGVGGLGTELYWDSADGRIGATRASAGCEDAARSA